MKDNEDKYSIQLYNEQCEFLNQYSANTMKECKELMVQLAAEWKEDLYEIEVTRKDGVVMIDKIYKDDRKSKTKQVQS